MTDQPFVFSDETGKLSDEEYTRALAWLSDIKGVIEDRVRRAESDHDWALLWLERSVRLANRNGYFPETSFANGAT